MVRNHKIIFRVTKLQHERIKNLARANSYLTMSAYLRDVALNKSALVEYKIVKINETIQKIFEALDNR